jgi:hypothetical protein
LKFQNPFGAINKPYKQADIDLLDEEEKTRLATQRIQEDAARAKQMSDPNKRAISGLGFDNSDLMRKSGELSDNAYRSSLLKSLFPVTPLTNRAGFDASGTMNFIDRIRQNNLTKGFDNPSKFNIDNRLKRETKLSDPDLLSASYSSRFPIVGIEGIKEAIPDMGTNGYEYKVPTNPRIRANDG